MRALLTRGRVWMVTMAAGGGLLVLDGCDATVRDTVLNGVGSAATGLASTFIQAFIQSLQADAEGDTSPTVKAIHDFQPQPFA
jgi:hypothetical protein